MLQFDLYPGSHTDQKRCHIQNISYVHQSRESPIMYTSEYMGNSLYAHQWAEIYNVQWWANGILSVRPKFTL